MYVCLGVKMLRQQWFRGSVDTRENDEFCRDPLPSRPYLTRKKCLPGRFYVLQVP